MTFTDRREAGRLLADKLTYLHGCDVVVLGLPRGGVPVAYEVARGLGAPLDVVVVRKVGVPWHPELAMGAVGEDGAAVVDRSVVAAAGIGPCDLAAAQARARAEVAARVRDIRARHARVPFAGRTAVVVDDGVATGSTARAACRIARAGGARRVVLAVPVAAPGAVARLADAADEVVCLAEPPWLTAVGQFYDDFTPTTDAEVADLLDRTGGRR